MLYRDIYSVLSKGIEEDFKNDSPRQTAYASLV